MKYTIYSDGGCHGNRKGFNCPGGYGFLILKEGEWLIDSGGGGEMNTTNNRMEMLALIKGVQCLKNHIIKSPVNNTKDHDCIIKTDSRYIVDNFNDYLPEWKKNGWRKSKGGSVLNKDLWKMIDELSPGFKSFKLEWVKGHANDMYNNAVDIIAQDHIQRLMEDRQPLVF